MRYGLAVGLSLVALLFSWLFWDVISGIPFILFIAAVVVSARTGGISAGILCSVISVILADYFLIEPIHQIANNAEANLQFAIFVLLAVLVGWTQETRYQSERNLLQAKQERDAILQAISSGLSVQDGEGKILYLNQAAATILGYDVESSDSLASITANQIRSSSQYEFSDESGQPILYEQRPHVRVFADGKPVELIYRRRHKETGQEQWIALKTSPIFDRDGEVTLVVNVFQDVSERRQSERELLRLNNLLEDQKAVLNDFIAQVPGIIWEIRAPAKEGDQPYVFVSEYAQKMLGYSPEEWVKNPHFWQTIIHPEDAEHSRTEALAIFESRQPGSIEVRFVASDERIIPVEARTTVVMDEAGKPVGLRGIMTDVTERWQATQQLARFAEELQRSNQDLQQFAYVASHDLQEPLRMVTSYLQLIQDRYKDKLDETANEFIFFAVDGAVRMKRLINDLLVYSRVQRSTADFTRVDCERLIETVLADLRFTIEDAGVTVTHDPLPSVIGNEAQLGQLLQNLIANAIKFRTDTEPTVHIGVNNKDNESIFFVADNGIGIDPKYLDRIFVIFQRLHGNNKYPGTGIGLAICRKVVENHGGRIWVKSTPGHGTTFYFALPKSTVQAKYAGN